MTGGGTFRTILRTLDELGYDLEWQVLNSKDFGVPQNRERVFIVGHLRGGRGRAIFPIGGTNQKACDEGIKRIAHIKSTVEGRTQPHQWGEVFHADGIYPGLTTSYSHNPYTAIPQQLSDGSGVSHAIDANYHKGLAKSQVGKGRRTHVVSYNRKAGIEKEIDLAYALNASNWRGINRNQSQTAVVQIGASRGRNPENPSDRSRGIYVEQTFEPAPDGLANTILTVQKDNLLAIRETEDGFHLARNDEKKSSVQGTHVTYPEGKSHCLSTAHAPMTMENIRIRRLTPRECWRLQGFPDWAFDRAKESGVSDTQLYRQAGNSVTVNVVYEIAKRFGD